jgi:hypothetical protein
VYSVREAMQWLRRSLRRHKALTDVDPTVNVAMCSSTPYGIRRQVGWKRGVWVGMNTQSRINPSAQDHAVACALGARLLGQLAPTFIRLPVRYQPFDEPPQRLALDPIERAPAQV